MADPFDTPGYRYSVNRFPGDGATTTWNLSFAGMDGQYAGYISKTHVKAYTILDSTGAETPLPLPSTAFIGPTTLKIEPAIPVGTTLVVYRDTPKNAPLLDYVDGALMIEKNLDTSNQQAIYAVAEMVDRFADALEDMEEFTLTLLDRMGQVEDVSNEAHDTADLALSTSNTALSQATAAVQTSQDALAGVEGATQAAIDATAAANAANTAAAMATTAANNANQAATDALDTSSQALTTAQAAETTANGIDAKATQALSDAADAVTTANGIDAKAQDALDTANSADAKADAAVTLANAARDSVDPRVSMGLTLFDSFSRPDTSPGDLGITGTGQAWDLRGPYVSGYPLPPSNYGRIEDGLFVADPACVAVYATQQLDETVTRMGARVSWIDSSGSAPSTFAMVSSVNNNFISDMMHFTVNRSGWKLQVREAGGAFVDLLTGSFSPTLKADGTIYTFEMAFMGRSATLNLNGKLTSVYDVRIPNNIGKYIFWEHFYTANPSLDLLRIHSAWSGCAPVGNHIGNAYHNPNTGATDFRGALTSIGGIINCAGTVATQPKVTVLPDPAAVGGFKRAILALRDGSNLAGWDLQNEGDGANDLRMLRVSAGVPTERLRVTDQGLCFSTVQNSITAAAGGGYANAVALTGQLCRVTTCASTGDSVKLPALPAIGQAILVINDGATSCNVFPAAGDTIDALSESVPQAVASGGRRWFYALSAHAWSSM